jgi:O-methyltransferase
MDLVTEKDRSVQAGAPDASKDLYLELLKKVLTASIYEQSSWSLVFMDRANWREDARWARLMKNHIKYRIVKLLDGRSYSLIKRKPLDLAAREVGRDWPQLLGYTMIGHKRLDNLQSCIEDVLAKDIQGDLIETGAWRGGATIFMRAVLKSQNVTDRFVWVADSFEGLPAPKDKSDGYDLSAVNHLKVSEEEVQENFRKFNLLDDQVKFLKGWFADTLPKADISNIAVLRLDGDMYSSTMDALTHLYPKVSKGGYVIVDDYYSWYSCKAAVTDYLAAHNIRADIQRVDNDAAFWRCE